MTGARTPHERIHRRSRPGRTILVALVLAGALVPMMSCDPCLGVIGCSSGPYLAATGQVIDPETRSGVDGVRVTMVRTGGVEVERDSSSAVTDKEGYWRLEFSTRSAGTLEVDATVAPPGGPPYRLRGLQLATRQHGGDANLNERWVTTGPYFYTFLELYRNGTADDRVVGARVEFRRTGGVALRGPGVVNDVYRGTTDAAGRLPLFPSTGPNAVLPVDGGTVVGDLVIIAEALGTTVIRDVRLSSSHLYKDIPRIERHGVGPSSPAPSAGTLAP